MQASKIIPGKVYAVKRLNTLTRFRVYEVITTMRRKSEKANPHDYRSQVDGVFLDHKGADEQYVKAVLEPEALLGEFSQYEELVKRKQEEDAAYKREQEGKQQDAIRLARALYQLAGIMPPPEKMDDYRNQFRAGRDDVSISRDGVVALLTAIMKLELEATQ